MSDWGNRIYVHSSNGDWIHTFGKQGEEDGCLSNIHGIAIDNENGDVYVCDASNDRI